MSWTLAAVAEVPPISDPLTPVVGDVDETTVDAADESAPRSEGFNILAV